MSSKKDKQSEKEVKKEVQQSISPHKIGVAEIVGEMEKSYIDYAMSVITQRALPSVEDGLKPVNRRILFAMYHLGADASKPTIKSARIVGETIGKYHPHGDVAVYDALVRMAQTFSLRYPLIYGQGNFGSMDGDVPAAMRYTEAKLSKISAELLIDIEKQTVKMLPNFDNTLREPVTLPAKLPNLLLNGSTGIAVGMTTNVPPHNLTEVCDAIVGYISNPDIKNGELMEFVKGPDFPTGGIIAKSGIRDLYTTGKGRIILRGKTTIEEKSHRQKIVINEIPYMVNKADLVSNIAKLATLKKLPDVSDLRDESAKGNVRIVIELRKNSNPKFTLNKLYKLTRLQDQFDALILALVNGVPKILTLKDVLTAFVDYRKIVIKNRSTFDLNKAKNRLEIVLGYLIALKDIDRVVSLIKQSKDVLKAAESLRKKFKFTEKQTKAVLEMRLQQLTSLEANKLRSEEKTIKVTIASLEKLLKSEREILSVITRETLELKKKYGDNRRTTIERSFAEISEQDLVEVKDVIVIMTNSGYIKRMDVKTYKEQKRGGAGIIGTGLKEEDFVESLLTCSTHDYLLFFTTRGRVYWLKANDVPDAARQSKGRSVVNLLSLRDEKIVNVRELIATKKGIVKKLPLRDLSKPRNTGVRIMKLPADGSDSIINVQRVHDAQEVILITSRGQAVRFNSDAVRSMGRASYGVRGVNLKHGDEVVALEKMPKGAKSTILSVTENGYGKRSNIEEYRNISRGGKGVITLKVTRKTGHVIGALTVDSDDSVIYTTIKGMVLRMSMRELRVMGRATQGVRLVRLKEGDKIADIVKIPKASEVIEDLEEEKVENKAAKIPQDKSKKT